MISKVPKAKQNKTLDWAILASFIGLCKCIIFLPFCYEIETKWLDRVATNWKIMLGMIWVDKGYMSAHEYVQVDT